MFCRAYRRGAAGSAGGVVARPVRRRLARRRAVGPRCGRHEGRDRRVYRCRPALARRTRAGLGRLDQPPDHRRRGSRGGQRHQESARMVGGARREARCLSRRRADFGQRPRRHDQDRPARQPDRAADRARRAGPHRLPATRRQCRPSPGGDVACLDQRRTRPRVRAFPAFDPSGLDDRHWQSGGERNPGRGKGGLQHPLQRSLERRSA